MDLTTRCPRCGTSFPVNLTQLQLRKGYVRCVQCAHIFDGYEAVVPAEPDADDFQTPEPVSGSAAADDVPAFILDPKPVPADDEPTLSPDIETVPVVPSVVRGRREFTISDHGDTLITGSEPSLGFTGTRMDESDGPFPVKAEHRIADTDRLEILADDRVPSSSYAHGDDSDDVHTDRWRSIVSTVWLVLILAGALVFVAQLVYVFRVQLAENIPALRPALEQMCDAMDCTVAYSRQPDMIVITQSSLQLDTGADDDTDDQTLLLQLTLRNAYGKPQEWPTLVLDLKDFSGASIARKNLPKDVYLPAEYADSPFPASSERVIALPLTMQGLKVNGYQLTAFFP